MDVCRGAEAGALGAQSQPDHTRGKDFLHALENAQSR